MRIKRKKNYEECTISVFLSSFFSLAFRSRSLALFVGFFSRKLVAASYTYSTNMDFPFLYISLTLTLCLYIADVL